MRSTQCWCAMVVAGAVAIAPAAASAQERHYRSVNEFYRATRLDLDVSLGGGYSWAGPGRGIGFTRVRSGVMIARWPFILSIGATYELSNLSAATYGAQVELLHIEGGFWGQAGPMVDAHGQFGGMIALGWSLFGVEAQYRGYKDVPFDRGTNDGYGFSIVGKVRIPIGFILYTLSRH